MIKAIGGWSFETIYMYITYHMHVSIDNHVWACMHVVGIIII